MAKRTLEPRSLKRPIELSIRLPEGDFAPVVRSLAGRAARLAGFTDGSIEALSRNLSDLAAAPGEGDLTLRFVYSRPEFSISLRRDGDAATESLLARWQNGAEGSPMDEAKVVGEAGARELRLVKSFS